MARLHPSSPISRSSTLIVSSGHSVSDSCFDRRMVQPVKKSIRDLLLTGINMAKPGDLPLESNPPTSLSSPGTHPQIPHWLIGYSILNPVRLTRCWPHIRRNKLCNFRQNKLPTVCPRMELPHRTFFTDAVSSFSCVHAVAIGLCFICRCTTHQLTRAHHSLRSFN